MKKLLFIFSIILLFNSCKKEDETETPSSSKTPYWEIDLTIDGVSYKYKSKSREASVLNSAAHVKEYIGGWWIDIIGDKSDPEYISGQSLPRSIIYISEEGICGIYYNWSFSTTPLPGFFSAGPIEHKIIQEPELAEINQDNFEITYKKPMILEIPKQTARVDEGAKSSVVIEGKITAFRDIL